MTPWSGGDALVLAVLWTACVILAGATAANTVTWIEQRRRKGGAGASGPAPREGERAKEDTKP